MATAQNVTNWFDLQKVSQRCIFKVRKFQLDTVSRFRMVEEKQEGGGAYFDPPGKIGLSETLFWTGARGRIPITLTGHYEFQHF